MPNPELNKRIGSGIVLAALAVGFIFYTPLYYFVSIAAVLSFIALNEYVRALGIKGVPISKMTPFILQMLFLLALWFLWQRQMEYAKAAALFVPAIWAVESFLSGKRRRASAPWLLLPLLWIALPFFSIALLRFGSPIGEKFIAHALIVAATSDIFAYFGGKAIGKHPLAKSISPNKTIEGSLVVLSVALIVGHFVGVAVFGELFEIQILAAINVGIVVFGAIGDLVESKFKRYCGIKDSGRILPGHGGILDRFDAHLLALPFFWIVLWAMGLTGF